MNKKDGFYKFDENDNSQLFKYSFSMLAANPVFLKNWKKKQLNIMACMITYFYFLVIKDIALSSNICKSPLKFKCLFF